MYLLRSVRLKNIKSYTESPEIQFTKGVNLIMGDIGAGKSSILEAIEGALLGYRVKDLLRIGSKRGEMEVELEPPLKVKRVITPVGSKHCQLSREGGFTYLSSKELREAVIKALKLMEPTNPNAEPIVTRSAIYVRQEELKRIIDEPEKAAEVVKRATGIMKYSIARDASIIVAHHLKEKVDTMTGVLEVHEKDIKKEKEVKKRKEEAERALALNRWLLKEKGEELEKAKEERAKAEAEKESVQKRHTSVAVHIEMKEGLIKDVEKEIEAKERRTIELKGEISKLEKLGIEKGEGLEKRLEEMAKKIETSLKKVKRLEELKGMKNTLLDELRKVRRKSSRIRVEKARKVEDVEEELSKLDEALKSISSELGALRQSESDFLNILKKGRCPVCGRDADPLEFEKHVEEVRSKLKELSRKKEELEDRRTSLKEELEMARKFEKKLELEERMKELEDNLSDLEGKISSIRGVEKEFKELQSEEERIRRGVEWLRLSKDLREVEKELRELKKRYEDEAKALSDLKKEERELKAKLEKAEKRVARAKEAERGLTEELLSLKEEEGRLSSSIKEAERELKEMAELKEKIKKLKEELEDRRKLLHYFQKVLPSFLEKLEATEISQVRAELESKFMEYFSILTQNEDWEVEVTDDFRPVFKARIDGKWSEVALPSGGQRSSLALAYRLALSWVARRHQGLKVGFLMLDEPTDGFSSEQLTRFQTLLDRLEADQVIIVSHHQELQSAADRVIKIENVEGASKVDVLL
jgi:exonuclease SbcC